MLAYMTTLTIFNEERIVIVREQANQLYSIIPYYFARTLVETPLFLMAPLVNASIFYFATGLSRTPEQFFKLVLALIMVV